MADDTGEVDSRFDTRIAAADNCDALALEQRAVAVRAIGNALVAIFGFPGDAEIAPAGTGRQDQAACLEAGAIAKLDRVQAAFLLGGH